MRQCEQTVSITSSPSECHVCPNFLGRPTSSTGKPKLGRWVLTLDGQERGPLPTSPQDCGCVPRGCGEAGWAWDGEVLVGISSWRGVRGTFETSPSRNLCRISLCFVLAASKACFSWDGQGWLCRCSFCTCFPSVYSSLQHTWHMWHLGGVPRGEVSSQR